MLVSNVKNQKVTLYLNQILFVLAILIAFSGCSQKESKGALLRMKPLNSSTENSDQTFHRLTPDECGIAFSNILKKENQKDFLFNGAGVCIGDYDGDGLPDIYLVSEDSPNKLFRQTSPLRFVDVTEEAGVQGGTDWGSGASFADIDNDGDLDLYVCTYQSQNLVYINNGDGTFTESAKESGLSYSGSSTMATFADFDHDGDLDLYLLNNRRFHPSEEMGGEAKVRMINGKPTIHPDYVEHLNIIDGHYVIAGQADRYYVNNGNGAFTDQTEKAGISGYDMGLSAICWDYNNDGWLDIYVGDDQHSPDHLYKNMKDGTFQDVIVSTFSHTTWNSMGADAGDLNNDGLIDFMIVDMANTTHFKSKTSMGAMSAAAWFLDSAVPRQYMRNSIFMNTNTEHFFEIANMSHLASSDWSWGIKINDLDNDGWNDIFITNGIEKNMSDTDLENDFLTLMKAGKRQEAMTAYQAWPRLPEENLVFKNLGDLQFQKIQKEWNLDLKGVSQAIAMSDLDRDGDLDIVINNMNEPVAVYRNDSIGKNSTIIELKGNISNQYGIGSRITIETPSGKQVRQHILASGYMSSDEPLLHFGLGEDTVIQKLIIVWPSGLQQVFENIPANHFISITEGGTMVDTESKEGTSFNSLFKEIDQPTSGIHFKHQEVFYDDFEKEPLLPFKLSQLGGKMAAGDVDGDDRKDLYFGGAAGQPGQLYLSNGDGTFTQKNQPVWENDKMSEDMGALFFDFDGDEDLDLYVTSGSNEYPLGDPRLQDRLYLNNGKGDFSKKELKALESTRNSSFVVAGSDFDKDGDQDLFIGARMIPGKYPLIPESILFINEKGQFHKAGPKTAPGLVKPGLVTDAIWSDYDGDSWEDLIITLEWGSILLFHNNKGFLEDQTKGSGLEKYLGWWTGIVPGDLDGDGDMDYVATNLGQNTKYHASTEKPLIIYCDDFDNSGGLDIIETKYEDQTHVPVRGRSCSSSAMPFIAERYKTYKDYALATVDDIYSVKKLSEAFQVSGNYFYSSVLLNKGDGQFEIKELPALAQASPAFSPILADFNHDDILDLFLAQNFFHPQRETGRWDGGLSLLLFGVGDGTFSPVWPEQSGIFISSDAVDAKALDINGDEILDLIVGINNEKPKLYLRRLSSPTP